MKIRAARERRSRRSVPTRCSSGESASRREATTPAKSGTLLPSAHGVTDHDRVRPAGLALAPDAAVEGDAGSARALLAGVLEKMDGASPPNDWVHATSETIAAADELLLLIALLET